jgi:hypothetical protein
MEAKERVEGEGNPVAAHSHLAPRARSPGLLKSRGGTIAKMYVELAEEILHARPENEDEAKAALERTGVRDGKPLAEWIERRRRLQAVR